jgi:hypothetical protein
MDRLQSLNPFRENSQNVGNNSASNRFSKLFGTNVNTVRNKVSGMNAILMIILFGLFVAGLVYVMMIIKQPKDSSFTLAEMPIKANASSIKSVKDSNKLPASKSSTQYALSFWIYVEAIENKEDYRLVLKRGGAPGALQSSNPLIYFDKMSNKMIIKVRTVNADTMTFRNLDEKVKKFSDVANKRRPIDNSTCQSVVNWYMASKGMSREDAERVVTTTDIFSKETCSLGPNPDTTINKDNCYYATFKIDYVPLQTWVNVLLNVDNNIVTLFMNGEKHSTRVLNENNDECPTGLSNIVSPSSGDIQVGNIPNGIHSFNGYLSRIQVFDNNLKTMDDVKSVYNKGPVKSKSVLKYLGLPLYGFRSPLYKIGGVKKQN